MRDLIDKINAAAIAYEQGNPIMSDKEWDDLYWRLEKMEEEQGIIYPDSPTHNIVYEVKNFLPKVEHNHPMLSLNKTKEIKEIQSFIGNKQFIAMCKMDGLTCSLTYENGKLIRAETRGNGTIGEDITHNAIHIPSIPKSIAIKDKRVVVDGEIICKYDDFEEFSEQYKHPRNFAAGSIRLLDAEECANRKLTFVAWDAIEGIEFLTLADKLKILENLKFIVVPCLGGKDLDEEGYNIVLKDLMITADELSYPIDGIVFKFNNVEYYNSLGATSHHFKGGMAYKFYDEVYETYLEDIIWTMGRTGVLTPVAMFETIEIDDTEVSKASLHNISIMNELLGKTPHKNQKIWVYKANMIIPQISGSEKTDTEVHFEIPTICPICGGRTEIRKDNDSEVLYCTNPDCEGKLINKLDHFCGKKGLDIKGLSKATLEKLIDWGWINKCSDIFSLFLFKKEWMEKPGFGKKSVENILNAIEKSKNVELCDFICAIGIPLIGKTHSKILAKLEYDWFCIRESIEGGFDYEKAVAGFGPERTSALRNFDYEEADKLGFEILNISNSLWEGSLVATPKTLDGIIFVITGKLNNFKNRDELVNIIETRGGKVSSSISAKTNYLINNDINSESSKNVAAKKKNIPIITEADFISQFLAE